MPTSSVWRLTRRVQVFEDAWIVRRVGAVGKKSCGRNERQFRFPRHISKHFIVLSVSSPLPFRETTYTSGKIPGVRLETATWSAAQNAVAAGGSGGCPGGEIRFSGCLFCAQRAGKGGSARGAYGTTKPKRHDMYHVNKRRTPGQSSSRQKRSGDAKWELPPDGLVRPGRIAARARRGPPALTPVHPERRDIISSKAKEWTDAQPASWESGPTGQLCSRSATRRVKTSPVDQQERQVSLCWHFWSSGPPDQRAARGVTFPRRATDFRAGRRGARPGPLYRVVSQQRLPAPWRPAGLNSFTN